MLTAVCMESPPVATLCYTRQDLFCTMAALPSNRSPIFAPPPIYLLQQIYTTNISNDGTYLDSTDIVLDDSTI